MGLFSVSLPLLVISAFLFSLSECQDLNVIAGLSNELAAKIHKKLSTGDENVFFSPMSISTALAMLYLGAGGKSAEEMKRSLGYQDAKLTDNEVHSAFRNLMETFSEDSVAKHYVLYVANSVLSQARYPFVAEYKNGLQEIYKASARNVDFRNQGRKAVQDINDWVKLKTKGKIEKLLDEIDPDTIMVLLNAVYFKGTWKTQFDPRNTMQKVFFNKGLETEQTKVPMMYLVEELPFARLSGAKVLELPYVGDDIVMVIVLPDAIDGLSNLEQELKPNTLRDMRRQTRKTRVHVTLPKFKLEYEKNLNTALQELDIKNVFENSANLTGISKAGPIAVSKVVHKAVVEVNEEGSEAAAVTGVIIEIRMGGLNNDFAVNHPFLFAIIDRKTDLIFFQGRVTQL